MHAEDDPVAVKDGVPYDEIQSNPYAFMVQTSHGGHLSWFEMNGERWFARTVNLIANIIFLKGDGGLTNN